MVEMLLAELIKHPVLVQTQRDVIFELRRIAFDGENDPTGTEKRKAMYTKDYKMLGFTVSLLTLKQKGRNKHLYFCDGDLLLYLNYSECRIM